MAGAFLGTTFDHDSFHVDTAAWDDSPVVYVSIAGVLRATGREAHASKILWPTLAITDTEGQAPNRARGVALGFQPAPGDRLVIALGAIENPDRLFAGTILAVDQVAIAGRADRRGYQFQAIDDTWRLSQRLVTGVYTGSATDIVADLMGTYAPDVTLDWLASDLPTIEGGISFTLQDVAACLTALATRIGGYWYLDYSGIAGDLHFYLDEADAPPTDLTPAHPTLLPGSFHLDADLSQVVTRALFEGGGSMTGTAVAPGETLLPLQDAPDTWYSDAGGEVVAGGQRLTYTGRRPLAGGSLVGTGASPAAAPALAFTVGTGIESGAHQYAVTFVTGAGESVASPIATITTGTLAAPASTLTAGTATVGTGVTTGSHDYRVTFVGPSSSETTVSATSNAITTTAAAGLVGAPGSCLRAQDFTPGNLVNGTMYGYRVTLITAIGETEGGSPSFDLTPAEVQPAGVPGVTLTTGGGLTPGVLYRWWVSFVTASGYETAIVNNADANLGASDTAAILTIPTSTDGRVTGRKLYRIKAGDSPGFSGYLVTTIADNSTTSYTDTTADGSLGARYYMTGQGSPDGPRGTSPGTRVSLTAIPTGDGTVTARRIYRSSNGGANYYLVTTLSDNSTASYTDNIAEGALGVEMPATNTTGTAYQVIPISAIPLGGAGTVARKLYRRFNGAGTFKLVTTIANNTATTYSDTVPNGSLGADAPGSNTAVLNQVAVSAIPIGGATVTARKVYRTAAAGSQLKLLATIADNTTVTYADSAADGTLGANVPTSDTSGLAQPAGQVLAGSTTLRLAAIPATFHAGGGWAVIGNGTQYIRYTGYSAGSLTGIPASGPGAIVETIAYNSNCSPAATLEGVPSTGPGSITATIPPGVNVNLLIVADDAGAQAVVGNLIRDADGDPTDGILEAVDRDGRMGIPEATGRAAARLARDSAIRLTAGYACRDLLTRAGKTITYAFPAPINAAGALKIQDVEITFPVPALGTQTPRPGLFPLFTVQRASSARFTFEDLLRRRGGTG